MKPPTEHGWFSQTGAAGRFRQNRAIQGYPAIQYQPLVCGRVVAFWLCRNSFVGLV